MPTEDGLGQGGAAPQDPETGSVLGVEDLVDLDVDAMAELFGTAEDQRAPVADADGAGDDDDVPPTKPAGKSATPADPETMSDEEFAEWITGQDPSEIRRGYLRQSDYTRKTQGLASERNALESRLAEVQQLQQQLLEVQKGVLSAAPGSKAEPPRSLGPQDLLTEDGELDLGKLDQYVKQAASSVADEKLTAKQLADQQAEVQREQQAVVQRIQGDLQKMERAFPHFGKDESVQAAVLSHMRENNVLDPRAAYAACYPREYAEAILRYDRAKEKAKTNNSKPAAPVTPPGTSGKGAPNVLDDPDAAEDAQAEIIAKALGVPLKTR